jgi:hypothetical protein
MLDKDKATMFHHNVAKLLFLCKSARPDIQMAIAFLCTRVKQPDNNNIKKLGRVMKYLWFVLTSQSTFALWPSSAYKSVGNEKEATDAGRRQHMCHTMMG